MFYEDFSILRKMYEAEEDNRFKFLFSYFFSTPPPFSFPLLSAGEKRCFRFVVKERLTCFFCKPEPVVGSVGCPLWEAKRRTMTPVDRTPEKCQLKQSVTSSKTTKHHSFLVPVRKSKKTFLLSFLFVKEECFLTSEWLEGCTGDSLTQLLGVETPPC